MYARRASKRLLFFTFFLHIVDCIFLVLQSFLTLRGFCFTATSRELFFLLLALHGIPPSFSLCCLYGLYLHSGRDLHLLDGFAFWRVVEGGLHSRARDERR